MYPSPSPMNKLYVAIEIAANFSFKLNHISGKSKNKISKLKYYKYRLLQDNQRFIQHQ